MCRFIEHGETIEARFYLTNAKRRYKHLTPLRSISRAYVKSEIRYVKVLARDERRKLEMEDLRQGLDGGFYPNIL